jgi:YidC/Oxa1 family membrane protein insertase
MENQKNLFLAIVLSFLVIVVFQMVFPGPKPEPQEATQEATQQATEQAGQPPAQQAAPDGAAPPSPGAPTATTSAQAAQADRAAVLGQTARLAIDSPRLRGSIALTGGRIDDLELRDYTETVEPGSPEITLLSPPGTPLAYFAQFGWQAENKDTAVPDSETPWQADGERLAPGTPVTLHWDNGQGLRFERKLELDADYMLTVTQRVVNQSDNEVTLFPYGLVSRRGTPPVVGWLILHEGPYGVFDGKLVEVDYDDVVEQSQIDESSTGGWIGITDKYWLVAVIPDQESAVKARFVHTASDTDHYQVDYLGSAVAVPAGGAAEATGRLFAGAKEVKLVDRYAEDLGIDRFDLAIDWGWLYFLTKPIFLAIDFFYKFLGNFGLAILLLTFLIKLAFFPLANKSYRSMSAMKKLQPEMMRLREEYGDDKQRMNQELMALYKKEKVNPASGCLPVVIQIPVFFALYKVLFITIEMRHAPFYGWIHDLSAPDPMVITTLFGMIPWNPPQMLAIGIWPLIMGCTMFLQQRLNPQPADPVQAKIFMFMPIFFTFLLSRFPAGLVIYWTWNNLLSVTQQWVIMRRMGVKA